ncbi:MAG: FAD-dependent oxidoreductase [Armatimonadota bacterium]
MSEAQTFKFTRDLPLRHDVDVFVAGGGPAGLAAALAAARQGGRVFLAEGHTSFGGMGTAGRVPGFCQFSDGVNFLAGGIGEEIYYRLCRMDGCGPADDPQNEAKAVCINTEVLKRLYDDLAVESGMNFAFQTHLVGVELAAPGQVDYVVCAAKSGLFAVRAAVYIDGTGDGDLAAWAGAPFEKGDANGALMPGTLCSLWAGVDWPAVIASGLSQRARLDDAFRDGVFSVHDRHLPGMWHVGEALGGGNIGHTYDVDGTDECSVTRALLWGRKILPEFARYYREYLVGFAGMELAASGELLGIRESRRILGDYVLNVEDFQARATFADDIGRYSYPVDIHASVADEAHYAQFEKEFYSLRYDLGENYGIPYRALTPRGVRNVLVAGRCVSTDRYVQSSIRVMPGCYITGQAAGVAAALAVERSTDTRGIEIDELQRRLRAAGAFLPEVAAAN